MLWRELTVWYGVALLARELALAEAEAREQVRHQLVLHRVEPGLADEAAVDAADPLEPVAEGAERISKPRLPVYFGTYGTLLPAVYGPVVVTVDLGVGVADSRRRA